MSTEQNKAIVRRLLQEVWNGRNLAALEELVDPNFTHLSPPYGVTADRDGIKQLVEMFNVAFPDHYTAIEDLIAEGEKVAAQLTRSGTHKGEFLGIPPTGGQVKYSLLAVYRIVGEKIISCIYAPLDLDLLYQLGVITEHQLNGHWA